DHSGRLHRRDFPLAYQTSCLGSQRRGHQNVVACCHQLPELSGPVVLSYHGIICEQLRPAAQRGDLHSEVTRSHCSRTANGAVTYDTQSASLETLADKWLPDTLFLLSNDSTQLEGEKQHRRNDPIRERPAEDPATIGERRRMLEQFGLENSL